MNRFSFFTLIITLLCPAALEAQVSDSVDVKNYDVTLDLSNGSPFGGYADLTVSLLRTCATVAFDLVGTVDSVRINGVKVANPSIDALPTAGIATGVDFHVQVWYRCQRYVESYGWGGFHFDSDMHYNLGVGFEADPHVMGRVMFPCRDNFHDKATYTLRVTAKAGWTAECGGMLQSRDTNADGNECSVWRIDRPTPTYLVSVSQAQWLRVHDTIASVYGDYPLSIGYRSRSEPNVRRAFAELDSVVPKYERCFGPYRWGRIGYIATHKGSMEHVNNIALAEDFVASTTERAQSTIAHELGHAWFGNLITCATEGDMWINEGGASFCSEVAMESVKGREVSDDYYQRNLEQVLRTTHVTDNGYRTLHDMPHHYTYGSTTYDKGWMVWHSLRGYLGEEVFYSAMNRLMGSCAFGNLDAYQLRDSLSLYSGIDLTDFFNFHVFSPGFVDYHVELRRGELAIRARSVGTTQTLASHRVPVTFYHYAASGELESAKLWVAFEGSGTTIDVEELGLPFEPTFCVLDRDCEISDVATVASRHSAAFEERERMYVAHFMTENRMGKDVFVEHHMAPSRGGTPAGVSRRANRYWMVKGNMEATDSIRGYFHYVRTGYSNGGYTGLDQGFYQSTATADSLGLFYRYNNSCPWQFVSRVREGNANDGWLVYDALVPGEYMLAVADFENLGIGVPEPADVQLFPNPLAQGQPLTLEVGSDEPFTVTIVDAGGRQVWQKTGCHNGQSLHPALTKGTYFVRIENNFISLQSKLIQL